jgi:tRNA/rRNA methyltransferase
MGVSIILVRPRFPENIGMAARAAANMGVSDIILVEPERWDFDKAVPLATGKSLDVLSSVTVKSSLPEALEGHALAFGLTARTGGWRDGIITPRKAAKSIAENRMKNGGFRVALVFGSEDRGLENSETALCTHPVTIPTAPGSSSLNLAQAVLIMLYECFTVSLETDCQKDYHPDGVPKERTNSPAVSLEEQERFFATLRDSLIHIEFLSGENPEWFMQPLKKRFFRRAVLSRHEFDLFMGICRKMMRLTPREPKA